MTQRTQNALARAGQASKPLKLFFCDLETTGLDPQTHGIVQIAGAVAIDNKIVESFNWYVRPFPNDKIEESALSINGLSADQFADFDDPAAVHSDLLDMLGQYVDRYDRTDKFHWIGYNSSFDTKHMRAWFAKNNDRYFGSWFFHPSLDCMYLAAFLLRHVRPKLENMKLATVASTLGCSIPSNLHDAQADINLTISLYNKLTGDTVGQS